MSGLIFLLTVPVMAQAPAETEKVDLNLQLFPAYYPNELIPGQNNPTFIEVRNNGSIVLNNIRFSAIVPDDWVVEFNPSILETLTSGSSYTVDVNIIPPASANDQDYTITLVAEAEETRTVNTLYLRVENSFSLWAWVGLGIGALVVIAFIIVFLRFGR